MKKTLIVYGTRRGTTTETVNVIAEVLRTGYGHEIAICESGQIRSFKKRINEFDQIILGSSIMAGRWKHSILSFAKNDLLQDKKVAVFVTAGGTLNKVQKYGLEKPEVIREAVQRYIDKYLPKFKFDPISKTAFGGKVVRKDIVKYNSWNKEDIISWAKDLGEKLN